MPRDPLADLPIQFCPNAGPHGIQADVTLDMIRQALTKGVGRTDLELTLLTASGKQFFEAYGYCGPHFHNPFKLALGGTSDELRTTLLFPGGYIRHGVVSVETAVDADQKEISDHG